MKRFLQRLASLNLAVVLLGLVLLALGTGTVIETLRGADVAIRAVYASWWLIALEVATVASAMAAIVVLYPWGRRRLGFLLTHTALGVILLGGILSAWTSVEGGLVLWEGESGQEIVQSDPHGNVLRRTTLPFVVRLDRFRIDTYPGTMQPSDFRSDVQIRLADGRSFATSIHMNHGLTLGSWRLLQADYNQEDGRRGTVLAARKDPGQPVVFAGYALLVIGLLVILGTRMAQARRQPDGGGELVRRPAAGWAKAAALAIVAATLGAVGWSTTGMNRSLVSETLQFLPVQHDGRVMPLDTLASEAVWRVTGERAARGRDAVADVLGWSFDPTARQANIIPIGSDPVAMGLGLPAGARHTSVAYLDEHRGALEEMSKQASAQGDARPAWAAAVEELWIRLAWMRRFVDGQKLRCQPASDGDTWIVPSVAGPAELLAMMKGPRPAGWPSDSTMRREVTYNRARPVRIAWLILCGALLLSALAWQRKSRLIDGLAATGLVAGFGAMTWGIAVRWSIAGRIPASNMYESLLFLGWGVGLFAVVAMPLLRNRLVVVNASGLAALTMVLTDLLPLDHFIHPMAAVLSGTPWLILHVPVTMVSYAVLALGVAVAHMQIVAGVFGKSHKLGQRMNDLLYWYMHIGQLLLAVGILTGSAWAASSWGRVWGWDPKEVWSLVAYLAYVALLHGRWGKLLGPFGVAVTSIIAFQTILMTYLGVNFVLTTGRHSYAMGDSPVARWMALVAILELVFLVCAWLIHRRRAVPGLQHL
jgi:ABC-type transport system involved in cytochrome c biogenesis permease subunit